VRFRLRTQLIFATLIISSAISGVCLLVVRHSVTSELDRQRSEAIPASRSAFGRVEREQQRELVRVAALLSELPTLKALMTSGDRATIQDASSKFWQLSGADLLVLATPDARVMGEHASESALAVDGVQRLLGESRARHEQTAWWQEKDTLFRVAIQPIVAGTGPEQHVLGLLVVGQHVNAAFARELANSSGSQIALVSGDSIVASTLEESQLWEFTQNVNFRRTAPQKLRLTGHSYDVLVVDLQSSPNVPLRCYMLLPLEAMDAYLHRLNRTILFIGLIASVVGAILVSLISMAITGPLESLVGAVRAFAAGDDRYSVEPRGGMEAVELANAFTRMRHELTNSQKRQVESERMVALGRAAGSISHDLRHHLAALVANAEFLYDAKMAGADRDEVYQEVLRATGQMTGLLDSLLEIAREQKTLKVCPADMRCVVDRAISAVRSAPEFHGRTIEVELNGSTTGEFDALKVERVFFNLLLNGCEATNSTKGRVGVKISSEEQEFECRIWDTGSGIPNAIREVLFEPFVSAGKNNGTGLGLAIAAKIVHDHGGSIHVEETSEMGTTFLLVIPRHCATTFPDVVRAS